MTTREQLVSALCDALNLESEMLGRRSNPGDLSRKREIASENLARFDRESNESEEVEAAFR